MAFLGKLQLFRKAKMQPLHSLGQRDPLFVYAVFLRTGPQPARARVLPSTDSFVAGLANAHMAPARGLGACSVCAALVSYVPHFGGSFPWALFLLPGIFISECK